MAQRSPVHRLSGVSSGLPASAARLYGQAVTLAQSPRVAARLEPLTILASSGARNTTVSPRTIERTYAVSDIHGHLTALCAALELVGLAADQAAELVLLGDYVDRGPASCRVLEGVMWP